MTTSGDNMVGALRQIVGIDGSPGSTAALDWALARVALLGPVEPVAAWHYPWWALVPTATGTLVPPGDSEFQAITERVVANMLERVDNEDVLDPQIIHAAAGTALVTAADRGTLLVVGTRGRGAVAGSVLGSVSLHCVNHARVPVAIVPADIAAEDRFQRVIVGIDGSDNADRAVQWAIDNTPSTSRIELINTWDPGAAAVAEVAVLAMERSEDFSTALVAEAIEAVRARAGETGHKITGLSRQGDARRVLRAEAEQADMLVVGARGHQGVAHLLLGSVATALVHQPTAATIVVH
ncbi:MAG: universal stress protein [Actinomycetia bacterium]|nr:universal stress protein [Actinomycetes bacterium]